MICHSRELLQSPVTACADVDVVPSCFHFVIIPLTVDRGIFSFMEFSWMGLLHMWEPITVLLLNSLSS
ncbi:unnamed protein product [Staurois parvus]|uniref:Uncharacterized protein n=1 Tax=Staurois parvus TaxID=386267 RepID=A0ABN9G6H4_9NEOB|nr:unnamed protein product [Staurois parvus]